MNRAQVEAEIKQAADKAADVLLQRVTYPVFFEKIAAAGVPVNSQASAIELEKLSHVVCPAVARSIERILGAASASELAGIKLASETASRLAGVRTVTPQGSTAGTFAADPSVTDAARALVREQIKAAGLADMLASPTAPKVGEEEDEEEKEKAKLAK
jgi:hypothetical protein